MTVITNFVWHVAYCFIMQFWKLCKLVVYFISWHLMQVGVCKSNKVGWIILLDIEFYNTGKGQGIYFFQKDVRCSEETSKLDLSIFCMRIKSHSIVDYVGWFGWMICLHPKFFVSVNDWKILGISYGVNERPKIL